MPDRCNEGVPGAEAGAESFNTASANASASARRAIVDEDPSLYVQMRELSESN